MAAGLRLVRVVDVTPAENHILRLQGRDEAFHPVSDIAPPFLLAIRLGVSVGPEPNSRMEGS